MPATAPRERLAAALAPSPAPAGTVGANVVTREGNKVGKRVGEGVATTRTVKLPTVKVAGFTVRATEDPRCVSCVVRAVAKAPEVTAVEACEDSAENNAALFSATSPSASRIYRTSNVTVSPVESGVESIRRWTLPLWVEDRRLRASDVTFTMRTLSAEVLFRLSAKAAMTACCASVSAVKVLTSVPLSSMSHWKDNCVLRGRGSSVGALEGGALGARVVDGVAVGTNVGCVVGRTIGGRVVGEADGAVLVGLNGFDGCGDGRADGFALGAWVGVGPVVVEVDGCDDGGADGAALGAWVVTVLVGLDGCGKGGADGAVLGAAVVTVLVGLEGCGDGGGDGATLGAAVVATGFSDD
jgi:hypothetical protein